MNNNDKRTTTTPKTIATKTKNDDQTEHVGQSLTHQKVLGWRTIEEKHESNGTNPNQTTPSRTEPNRTEPNHAKQNRTAPNQNQPKPKTKTETKNLNPTLLPTQKSIPRATNISI